MNGGVLNICDGRFCVNHGSHIDDHRNCLLSSGDNQMYVAIVDCTREEVLNAAWHTNLWRSTFSKYSITQMLQR